MSSVGVFLSLPIFVVSALQEVTVRPSEDALLQCHGPRGVNITLLEWSRPELQSDGYVLFVQNRRPFENYHHEFFKGRVQLMDPSMKDGDVSVILRNVSIRDAGTYKCLITTGSIRSAESVTREFQYFINLTVTASGFTDENIKEGGEKDGGDKDGGDKDGGDKDASVFIAVIMSGLAVLLLVVIVAAVINVSRKKASSAQRDERCDEPLTPE